MSHRHAAALAAWAVVAAVTATAQATDASQWGALTMVTSQPSFHVGDTRTLAANCSFTPRQGSDLAMLTSLILSKSPSTDISNLTEIASVMLMAPDTPNIVDDFGAVVKGHLELAGTSFLSYTWTYPQKKVEGRYDCVLTALDKFGHPVSLQADADIDEHDTDLDMMVAKIKNMENIQDSVLAELKATKQNLTLSTQAHQKYISLQNAMMLKLNETESNLTKTFSELDYLKKNQDTIMIELNETKANLTVTSKSLQHEKDQNNDTKAMVSTIQHRLEVIERVLYSNTLFFPSIYSYCNHIYIVAYPQPIKVAHFQDQCKAVGGYLAEFNDDQEWGNVTSYLYTFKGHINENYIYFGLTDQKTEGHWTLMMSDTPNPISQWGGNSVHVYGNQDCAVVQIGDANPVIYDHFCDYTAKWWSFVCEIPL